MSPRKSQARRFPLVIVANTLPVRRVVTEGKGRWETSPGGLVSALTPIVSDAKGAWVGWSGRSGAAPDPFTHDGITNLPVPISEAEVRGFYHGVCNRTLWPLYHHAVRQPEYHRHWWSRYEAVNARFAAAAAAAAAPNGLVWVQDYHLQLVPQLLRTLRADLRIGFFLHIPFPPRELFARLPWRRQIVQGLLGADVVGFQTTAGAANFARVATRVVDVKRRGSAFSIDGRTMHFDAFPISIDVQRFADCAADPAVIARADEIRHKLAQGQRIMLGVDRLDYTKGIDVRLKAYSDLLSRRERTIRDVVMVQVAVPSRERILEYKDLRRRVEELVGQINGEFAEVGLAAVHYLRRNLPFEELVAMYRAAEVMVVTPFADGMNLVAKEFVATRLDNTGVLILSEFAGAAQELRGAIQVNPHDVDGMSEAMDAALDMSAAEATRRMRALRRRVSRHTVHDWAQGFLDALAAD